jgi:hypothetical protein
VHDTSQITTLSYHERLPLVPSALPCTLEIPLSNRQHTLPRRYAAARAQAPGSPAPPGPRPLSSRTWHPHGARLLRRAPDPQLAELVVAPAHDPATQHDGARVQSSRGDGGGGEAWEEGGVECVGVEVG